MQVYMLKDVEKIGMAGQIIKVSDGYASNFLIPRKLAIKVSKENIDFFNKNVKKREVDKKVLNSKASMLSERIKNMHLTIKKRSHNEGKLYGAVSADEIVEILKEKGISINKKQVEFSKSVRSTGEHIIIIRLSSKLKPELSIKVIGQDQ